MTPCRVCEKNIDDQEVWRSSTGAMSYCEACYKERYFYCLHDGRWKLNRYGVIGETGDRLSTTYAKEYMCAISGVKFFQHPAVVRTLGNGNGTFKHVTVLQWGILEARGAVVSGVCVAGNGIASRYCLVTDCTKIKHLYYLTADLDALLPSCSACGARFESSDLKNGFCTRCNSKRGRFFCGGCGNQIKKTEAFHKHPATVLKSLDAPYCDECLWTRIVRNGGHINSTKLGDWTRDTGRRVGIEIECNPDMGWVLSLLSQGLCHVHVDGSLRNAFGFFPVEIVSPYWVTVNNVGDWLRAVLKNSKAELYRRCGIHVAVQSDHMSWFGLNCLGRYLYRREAEIVSMTSPTRIPQVLASLTGGPVALPEQYDQICNSKRDYLTMLYGEKFVNANRMGTTKILPADHRRCNDQGNHVFRGGYAHRNHWMNFHYHYHRGCLENRLLHGTLDYTTIYNWVIFTIALIDKGSDPRNLDVPALALAPEAIRDHLDEEMETFKARAEHLRIPVQFSTNGFPIIQPSPTYSMPQW